MQRLHNFLVISLLALLLSGCDTGPQSVKAASEAGRQLLDINHHWQFVQGPQQLEALQTAATTLEWQEISLPHTWNATDGQDGGDNFLRGDGWYKKQLQLDESLAGKRLVLHFDGANTVTDAYLNGQHLGQHRGGYAAFRFDLTDHAQLGETNTLLVKVNNERHSDVAPLSGDFTFFGGIYRQVRLLVLEAEHIDVMNHASPGVFIGQTSVSTELAELDIATDIVIANAKGADLQLQLLITDAEGQPVATQTQALTPTAEAKQRVDMAINIDQPTLWQGLENPYLYQVEVALISGDQILDKVSQPLGLRSYSVDPERGFILNGQPTRLFGVSRHQDLVDKGWALSPEDHRADFELIKELGASAVRLAHYQHDPYVYQLADEAGLAIWAEIPMVSEATDSEAFWSNAQQQLRELIRQNYNHPSIFFWGLFNEISIKSGELAPPHLRELQALAKQEDPGRLTTGAVLGHNGDKPVGFIADLAAENRYDGWYYNDFDGLAEWADRQHKNYPMRAFSVSEYGAGASWQIQSDEPKNQDHSEQYQSLYHEEKWKIIEDRPFLWSSFVWNMFDFASDLRDEGDFPGINDKGLISHDRQIKKDAFYWYKANWNPEPMLHITGRRLSQHKRPTSDIKVYSNREKLELFVNGQSQGIKQALGEHRTIWPGVELALGDNRVEVVSLDKSAPGEARLEDSVNWRRILNDDTRLAAVDGILGIDLAGSRIVHTPAGLSYQQLEAYLQLPYGARIERPQNTEAEQVITTGDTINVLAANGDSRRYTFAEGALSMARPVKASREQVKGMMGYPASPAINVVDGVAKLDGDMKSGGTWVTADPKQGPGWLKIDLGADYYLEQIESSWLPSALSENGRIQYSIDIASDVKQSAVVFSETYREHIDRRDNQISHQTRDDIKAVARYLRVNLLDSSYQMNVPIMGDFKIFGATEFSLQGGLVYSEQLVIDYALRSITLDQTSAANTPLTAAELTRQLRTSGPQYQLVVMRGQQALKADEALMAGDLLLVSEDTQPGRRESYSLVL